MELFIIFLTGLTTGIFMCIPMCGGIMTSCIMCAEQKIAKNNNYLPITLYLVSKLASYTLVGGLLGYLGSFFQISNEVRAYIAILAGAFMIILALQLLNVHPFFKRFSITTPKFLLKLVKSKSKDEGIFAPVILGVLTAFLPCGPMQAAQVIALSSGNSAYGATIMFAFGLGTSPALFGLGVLVKKIGDKYKEKFLKVSGVFVLILAVIVLNRGLILNGAKYNFSFLTNAFKSKEQSSAKLSGEYQEVTLKILNGYEPETIKVKKGIPVRLKVLRYDSNYCSRDIVIKEYNIYKLLENGTKTKPSETLIEFTPGKEGTFIFSCGMGMLTGRFIVE